MSFVSPRSIALAGLVFLLPVIAACNAAAATAAEAKVAVNPQTPAARAWGFADSDIPVDPNVVFGVLPNGMKYALLNNRTPKGGVAVRMHIGVGSLVENDDERGLVHFLEHMAFNGSTHVPEGDMVKLLARKGLAFGADSNASTGLDETVYMLNLPTASADMIDTGLMLMRETASELTIAPDAVERERGVVLSEIRGSDSPGRRNRVDALAFLLPDTILSERPSGGTEQTVLAASASQLRSLYDRYYRPENAILVMVGDFDVEAVEPKLRARFADWTGRGSAGAEADIGSVDFSRPAAAHAFVDPAIDDIVSLTFYKPWIDEPRNKVRWARELAQEVAEAIVDRRFARIAAAVDSPIIEGGMDGGTQWGKLSESISISAAIREGAWRQALPRLEQEYRRALEHGFTQGEVEERLARFRASIHSDVAGADTRSSQALADGLIRAGKEGLVFTRPETSKAMFDEVARVLDAGTVSDAFRAHVAGVSPPLVRITAKAPLQGGTDAVIAVLRESGRVAVTPPADTHVAAFAYEDFGPAGEVVDDERIDDLGIRRIRFANNVMLNIKRTDFEAGRVRLSVRVDGGELLATRDDPTRVLLAGSLAAGGLEAHDIDDLRTLFAGSTVQPVFGAGADFFGGAVAVAATDLRRQAGLFAAYVAHPGYSEDGLALFRRAVPQQYATFDATPGAVMDRDVSAILANDDPRAALPSLERVMGLDWQGLRAAISDSLAHGAIEIGVVGDIEEEQAIAAIASTFGAFPERRAAFDPRTEARKREWATDSRERVLIHKGAAGQARIAVYWPVLGEVEPGERVRVELLARTMQLMLLEQLREKLGESYAPAAGNRLSDDHPGFGYLAAASDAEISALPSVRAAIFSIARQLRERPVDSDLLDRVRRPILEELARSRRDNGYWLAFVDEATTRAGDLDRIRNTAAEVAAATPAQLRALARRYLVDERALVIKAVSDKRPH